MSKLLHANFSRLRKDKTFWTAEAFMFLLGIFVCISQYMEVVRYKETVEFDSMFFNAIAIIGVLIAAFSSMYVGTEYSDGVIRNKIVIGHRRKDIYMTNFLMCTTTGLLSYLCYIIVVSLIGIPLFGFFSNSLWAILLFFIDSLLLIVAYSAIFNLIAMLISNKAYAAIISMIVIFAALIVASIALGMLQEPEYVTLITTIDGQMQPDTAPNPRYLTGMTRDLIQLIADVLPTGQSLQISWMKAPNLGWMALYSVIISILANMIGVLSFNKKDLK